MEASVACGGKNGRQPCADALHYVHWRLLLLLPCIKVLGGAPLRPPGSRESMEGFTPFPAGGRSPHSTPHACPKTCFTGGLTGSQLRKRKLGAADYRLNASQGDQGSALSGSRRLSLTSRERCNDLS